MMVIIIIIIYDSYLSLYCLEQLLIVGEQWLWKGVWKKAPLT